VMAKVKAAASLLARMAWWFACGMAGQAATGTFAEVVFFLLALLGAVGYWLRGREAQQELEEAAVTVRLLALNEAVGVCRSVVGECENNPAARGARLCVHYLVMYRNTAEDRLSMRRVL
jgi:hypothetical protein